MSREFIAQLQATQVVHVSYTTASSAELDAADARGRRASMAVVIPRDFERRLQSDTRPPWCRSWSMARNPARRRRRAASPRCRCSRATARARIRRQTHGAARIEIRTLYNPEKRTAVQIVPALIGVILSMTMVLFTSGAIVRERERGNLELLIATPSAGSSSWWANYCRTSSSA